MGLFDIFSGDTIEKYEYNPLLQEIPKKSTEIFKSCYKEDDEINIGITETMYAVIFALDFLTSVQNFKLSGNAKKALLNISIKDTLCRMQNNYSFLTHFELKQLYMVRKTYYNANIAKFSIPNNMIKRYEYNEKMDTTEELLENPLISSLRGILFFYYLDLIVLYRERMPFSHGVDMNKYAFLLDDSYKEHIGYESQKIADLIFKYAEPLSKDLIAIAKKPVD